MKFTPANIFKFILFTLIGFTILYFLYVNQNAQYLEECAYKGIPDEECSLIDKLLEDFASIKLFWIFLILIIFMISNLLRALRWQQLLASVDEQARLVNALGAIMIGYFTNLGIPRIGEFIKVGVIAKYDKLSVDKVMGTVVLDRIIDFLFFGLFIGLGFLCSFDLFADYFRDNLNYSNTQIFSSLGFLILAGFGTLYILYLYLYVRINDHSPDYLKKARKLLDGFIDGLKSVAKIKSQLKFWAYSAGIWICYYLMTYLCFFSFAPTAHLGAKDALIVFVFGTLGMIIPTPGGIGSYQYLVHKALIILGIGGIAAFSFANILFFSISVLCNVIFGLLFLWILPFYNARSK